MTTIGVMFIFHIAFVKINLNIYRMVFGYKAGPGNSNINIFLTITKSLTVIPVNTYTIIT
ncbi:hypothetical protein CWD78_21395 [Dickeya dadantii]|nr:hypothetical protein [Dickeya dadantii]